MTLWKSSALSKATAQAKTAIQAQNVRSRFGVVTSATNSR